MVPRLASTDLTVEKVVNDAVQIYSNVPKHARP
jgi:hypothetical protein